MDDFRYIDIFSSKGLEYLLVIGFLIAFWLVWCISRIYESRRPAVRVDEAALPQAGDWFRIDDGLRYHQGHTWARPEGGGVFAVGIDDFAAKLLGAPDAVTLPAVGSRLRQGARGWTLNVRDRAFGMLSPIGGRVISVNDAAASSPGRVSEDPYGEGWLLKVRAPDGTPDLKNLLSGGLARAWKDETVSSLRGVMAAGLGATLQDGGVPASGFGLHLSPERWYEIVADFLLCERPDRRE